ncbi:MAG: tetratricopeptide repeat protein, partial [Myxococcales bacterium]|nr:tetratricopeptide repeat protein [Myxococcales bacterium]
LAVAACAPNDGPGAEDTSPDSDAADHAGGSSDGGVTGTVSPQGTAIASSTTARATPPAPDAIRSVDFTSFAFPPDSCGDMFHETPVEGFEMDGGQVQGGHDDETFAVYLRPDITYGDVDGDGVEEALVGAWDRGVRATARAAFAASGVGNGDEVWGRIEPAIDAYARDWALSRAETCAALEGRDSGAVREVAERRDRCLDRRLAELRGLTEVLREADTSTVLAATESVARLTSIDACDDAERLRREAALPAAIGERALIEAMRREVARLRVQVRRARAEGVAARAESLTGLARRLASPTALAEVLHLRGIAEDALGSYENAAAALEEAVYEAIAGRHDRVHAEAAVMLVWVYGAQLRERATAERWIPHAEAAIRGVRGGPLLAADLLNHRGVIANLGHEVEAAERFHREALAIRRAHLAPTHVHVLDSLTNIGLALLRQRRLAEAERLLVEALAGYRETFGPRHPRVAALLSNLGEVKVEAGAVDDGIAALEEALALKEAVLGPEHASLISTLNNLGNVYSDQGRRDLAGARLRRALAIAEREFGAESPRIADLLHNYALYAERGGEVEVAVTAARRSIAIQAALLGPDHPRLVATYEILATAQLRGGALAEAEAAVDRGLEIAAAAGDRLDVVDRVHLRISAAEVKRARGAAEEVVGALVDAAAAEAADIDLGADDRARLDALLARPVGG